MIVEMHYIRLFADSPKAFLNLVPTSVFVAVFGNIPPIKKLKVGGRECNNLIPLLLLKDPRKQSRAVCTPSSILEFLQELNETRLYIWMPWFEFHDGAIESGLLDILIA